MPPKKQKEKILTLEDLAAMANSSGGGGSWADDEAELSTPSFQTVSQPAQGGASGGGFAWASGGGPSGGFASGGGRGFGPAPVAPIPDQPPFTARIGNVSYDVNESILEDFFAGQHNLKIESLRLPRGPDGQIKGAAYIDFADRDSLVSALKLGGAQILGRTVSVSVAEQRGPPSGFGGGFGAEFDWSKREDPNEVFGRGPPPTGGDGDRFSRFRPRAQASEPEPDWSARSGPLGGGPARAPREPEPELDWGARTGPIAARTPRPPREPEPELDWSARTGPIAARSSRPPRAPREPEPEFDWSARTGPIAARRHNNHSGSGSFGPSSHGNSHRRKSSADQEWGHRTGTPARAGRGKQDFSTTTTASSTGTVATPEEKKKANEAKKIAKLQQGFKALELDDEN